MSFDNKNRGAAWTADKVSDKHPDYKGTINVDGTDYWLSVWKNGTTSNSRAPALSFSVKKVESDDQIPF